MTLPKQAPPKIYSNQKADRTYNQGTAVFRKPKQNILDLFGGSGRTLIACEQTRRRAFLMELDELYHDVIVKRWEEFTGKEAELIK